MTSSELHTVYICEELPSLDGSDASRYNLDIIKALQDARCKLHIIVTGVNPAQHSSVEIEGNVSVYFLHARIILGQIIPYSVSSLANCIWRKVCSSASAHSDGVAYIGTTLSKRNVAQIKSMIKSVPIDLMFIDTIFNANALYAIPEKSRTMKVLVAQNVLHYQADSFAERGVWVIPEIGKREESRLVSLFDWVIAKSRDSSSRLLSLAPTSMHAVVLPNSVTINQSMSVSTKPTHNCRILYIGSDVHANVAGMRWFFEEAWPHIRKVVPTAELDVVGGIAAAFSDPIEGVTFHGKIKDVSRVARRCGIAINPTWMVDDSNIKMINYFRLGLGCITTEVGAEGLPVEVEQPFITAKHGVVFINSLITAIRSPEMRDGLADRIPNYFDKFEGISAAAAVSRLIESVKISGADNLRTSLI